MKYSTSHQDKIRKIRYITLTIYLVAIALGVRGQTNDNVYAKNALQAFWLAYEAWNSGNCDFIQADAYLMQGDQIIGQKFLKPSTKKYLELLLQWDQDQLKGAKTNDDMEATFTWNGQQVSRIKIPFLYEFDYGFEYIEDGKIINITKNTSNNKVSYGYKISLDGNKIQKLISTITKGKPWVSSEMQYTYNPDGVTTTLFSYEKGKPQKDKFISDKRRCSCAKVSKNTFEVTGSSGAINAIRYNESDLIEYRKTETSSYTQEEYYFYQEDQLFKKEEIRNNQGVFISRIIDIYSVPETFTPGMANYEKQVGTYKFDINGDLIYEGREGRYRTKVNNVWSDWKIKSY